MGKVVIRKGVFETNSSSIHSIVIGNDGEDIFADLPKTLHFGQGDFGWDPDTYSDTESKAAYLWQAIVYNSDSVEEANKYKAKIIKTLSRLSVKASFDKIETKTWDGKNYCDFEHDNGYIDHSNELKEFIKAVMNDDAILMNYLFSNESSIATGNDNGWDGYELGEGTDPKNVLYNYEKAN